MPCMPPLLGRAKWFLRRSFTKTLQQGAATTLCMALHPVPTPAVGDDMTQDLYWYCSQIFLFTLTERTWGRTLHLPLVLVAYR